MKRREFFKNSLVNATAIAGLLNTNSKILKANNYLQKDFDKIDLVAVRNGEPDVMFDKGIQEFGGMKEFVKKGQTVVIKPNIGWDVVPERAGNTNPKLVSQIVKHCLNAGAKEVYVFDNTCDNWTFCYKNSGIERAVKDAGGKVVPGNAERYYQDIKIPSGKKLKNAKVHELILESDVFINVPILKHHSSARLTISMKNLMGIVWNRGIWHSTDLHQCIADFSTYRKPDLNIVDAYYVLKKNGPRGVSKEDVALTKNLLISKDMVLIDSAAAKIFGLDPSDVNYIKIANSMNIGNMNLEEANIKRIAV